MSLHPLRALALVGSLPVLWLLVGRSFDSSDREIQQSRARLLRLAELDANLDEAALELRYGLREDYDVLVAIDRELRKTGARLARRTPGESSARLLEALELESELVDEFKSSHAILRNSVAFLPTVLGELENATEDTRIQRRLVDLERGMLRVVVTGEPEAHERVAANLDGLRHEPALAGLRATEDWQLLEGHTRAILRYEPEARSLLSEITTVPSRELLALSLAEAEVAYREWRAGNPGVSEETAERVRASRGDRRRPLRRRDRPVRGEPGDPAHRALR